MAKIHVLDNRPFGSPDFKSHEELGELCIGPDQYAGIKSVSSNAEEWSATSMYTLDELASARGVPFYQRPIAGRMKKACEIIGDKLPPENPELRVVLCAVGQIFDAELEIRKVTSVLADLETTVFEGNRALLSGGIRGVSLEDIEKVEASTA
ncbi:hypothetical protein H6800_00405 [Candidatus Nomurabacteria bacterium]|nr:hypothetical protein [Candidatus Nomurabacteria bacterium]